MQYSGSYAGQISNHVMQADKMSISGEHDKCSAVQCSAVQC